MHYDLLSAAAVAMCDNLHVRSIVFPFSDERRESVFFEINFFFMRWFDKSVFKNLTCEVFLVVE